MTLKEMDWIKVEDRIPEEQQECLILFRTFEDIDEIYGSGFSYTLATFQSNKFVDWIFPNIMKNPLFWMPLPIPPKDDNEDDDNE